MTDPPTYSLYGLTFSSEFPLEHVPATDEHPRFTITRGDSIPATMTTLDGDVLLDFATNQPWYTLTDGGDHFRFRVYGVCDFVLTQDLASVVLHPEADMTPGMEAVMITGTLSALHLYLQGHLVLHASAVQADGWATGFIGHSGSGKTTLAAIMCSDGTTSVVTDDVLRVDSVRDHPVARRGANELRLRSGTETLSARIDPTGSLIVTSADQRSVLRPPGDAPDHLPLRCLVLPRPIRDSEALRVERLAPKDAMMAVLSFPRLMGWRDPRILSRIFSQVGALVEHVPVLVAQVPWGPPFDARLGVRLHHAIDSVIAG